VDLRGHGDSDWASDGNYSLKAFADDIHTIAASFKRPPLLVGASLGGIISLILAGEKATPMRALVLVDVAPEVEESGVKRIIAFMQRYHEGFETLAAAAEAIHNYLPHRSRPRSLNGLKKNLRQGANGRYYWRWDPRFLTNFEHDISWKGERLSAAARRLHIPVLLVRGVLSDVVSPATAKEFLKLVPHAQHVDLAAAGHMIAGDTNDAFTQVILEFFNRLIVTEKKR
jgi:non-heme chloroperoxidase